MTDRPLGSVLSGEFVQELWTEGEVFLYAYTKGKPSFRLKLIMNGKDIYCTHILDDDKERPFDLNGFLHTLNDERWGMVVFTNFWFAYAYEQKLKTSG